MLSQETQSEENTPMTGHYCPENQRELDEDGVSGPCLLGMISLSGLL